MRTASGLFIECGYDSVRIADIAEKAGISQGLLYGYFQDKEDLLLAIVLNGIDEIGSALPFQAPAEGKAEAQLVSFIDMLLAAIYKNPRRLQMPFLGSRFPGQISEAVNELFEKMKQHTHALIALAQEEGKLAEDEPDVLSFLLLSTLQGIAFGLAKFGARDGVPSPTKEQVFRASKKTMVRALQRECSTRVETGTTEYPERMRASKSTSRRFHR
jgi:AcrR family transcriptional regulator